jgi:hypothetical protein
VTRFSDGEPLITPEGSDSQRERRWYYTNFRQAAGRSGSAYGVGHTADDRWGIECVLPDGTKRRLGAVDRWEDALRIQDYCVQRDTAVKLAIIELYENANYTPLEKLLADALTFGQLPRRRMRVTLEVDVEMRGTDDEIATYLLFHARSGSSVRAARVTSIEGPRLEEPRV